MTTNDIDDLIHSFKLVLIGDSGVGKTNIANRYTFNQFYYENKSTIGVEYFSKNITIENTKIKVHIWDSAGQERFRSITKSYYRGAKGAFVVYDVTKPESFENSEKWVDELIKFGEKDLIIYLIGNKIDLNNFRKITSNQGLENAKLKNLTYIETSAQNGDNINLAFDNIISEIFNKSKDEILDNNKNGNNKSLRKKYKSLIKDDKIKSKCC